MGLTIDSLLRLVAERCAIVGDLDAEGRTRLAALGRARLGRSAGAVGATAGACSPSSPGGSYARAAHPDPRPGSRSTSRESSARSPSGRIAKLGREGDLLEAGDGG